MADHVIAAGDRAKHKATLAAGVVDTVTFTTDPTFVEVVCYAASDDDLFMTIDGTTPAVAGPKTFVVPVGSVRKIRHDGNPVVALISAGAACKYSVTGV